MNSMSIETELYIFPPLSFLLCLLITPLVRKIAIAGKWLAYPQKERWHKKPTALLGGVAIYIALAVPLYVSADFSRLFAALPQAGTFNPVSGIGSIIWIGMTLLFLLGIVDDFKHIKPYTKLVGQIMAASLAALLGFRLTWFTSLTIDTIITIVWIVGITNAFNLLDNMDGLCAGIGCVSAVFLALIFINDFPQAALVALVLAASLAAFLVYNFNPASIFMGDSGSLVIGFTISLLTLCHAQIKPDSTLAAYAVPVMIVMVPILDTTLVSMIRILSGRKASVGGRDHTSHRLVLMGLTERGAVLFLCGIGTISGIAAWFVNQSDTLTSPTVIIPLALSIILMAVYLSQLRVYPEKEFSLLRDRTFTPVLVELTYKRQLLLVILDFCLIAFAYYLSYRLRFDAEVFPYYFKVFLQSLPAVIACKLVAFFTMGVYRGIWQFLSTNDVMVYIKASLMATFLSVSIITFMYRFIDFSKGIFLIDWMLTLFFLIGSRGFFRLSGDIMKRKTLAGDSVLIYGAGRGGEILLREILNNPNLRIKPMGFIDDDPLKSGKKLQGYPVLGTFHDLEGIIHKHSVSGLLISFKNDGPEGTDRVKRLCQKHNLTLKQFSIHVESIDLGK